MKILGLHSKGYAPATSGGTIYHIAIEVEMDRFPSINKDDAPFISLCVENRSHKIRLCVISRSAATESFWGEDEKLTSEEKAIVLAWATEHKVVEDAKFIVAEDKRLTKELDVLYAQHGNFCSQKIYSAEDATKKWEMVDRLGKQIDALYKERENLKYILCENIKM